jgi:hypothetical protein
MYRLSLSLNTSFKFNCRINSVFSWRMNKQSVVVLLTLLGTLLFTSACRHDPLTPLEDAPVISFKDSVLPVFISNCSQAGCHGSGGGEFPLISYSDIIGRISPGKPHSSQLYKVITSNAFGAMPPSPNPKVSDTDIKTIYLWIMQGANDN